jgi:hypothetical protein
MWTKPITVVETSLFLRQAERLWTDEERDEFVTFIALNPEAGDVIPETGGVRKVRWQRQGTGKRGGTRIIYFVMSPEAPLYLLLVYAKGRREDLSPDEKHSVRDIAAALKRAHRQRDKH